MTTDDRVPGASRRRRSIRERLAGRRGALRLLAVVLAGVGCLACASSQTVQQAESRGQSDLEHRLCPEPRDESQCTPSGSVPLSACKVYEENRDWLPPAYVFNATCICALIPDDPTAQCARAKIVAQTIAAPAELREQGRLCNSKAGVERDACIEKHMTPAIYQIHVNAYTECCCPCGPSPPASWTLITLSASKTCPDANKLFDLFGSCDGTPGQW